MSDLPRAERRAILNRRKMDERRGESGSRVWRTRYLYPHRLDDEKMSDRELFDMYYPLARASEPPLAEAMLRAFTHADMDGYSEMVSVQPGEYTTRLSAFFARATMLRSLDFDEAAIEYIAALPHAFSSEYPAAVVSAVRELLEQDDIVPPGYAAPLIFAGLSASTIIAAHLDSMPLEFVSLLGVDSF